MKKKLFALLTAICMIVSMLPMIVLAAGNDLEDLRFETWTGEDGKNHWNDIRNIAPGSNLYFVQADAGSGYSYLTQNGADAENYVVKIVYPENEEPTVYFNGLDMVQPGGYAILFESEGADNSLNVNLVIEKDSSYTIDGEGWYGCFEYYVSNGTFTISSVDGAKLSLYAEDQGGSQIGTIWARGNLVIDGANLDVSADEGYAIGADGTITVKDSDVVAWSEKELAFNKAVTVEGELGAIASTTNLPNDEDLVEYDAAAWDTYKYVHFALPAKEPADVVTEAWTLPELELGQAKYYVIDSEGALTEAGASAENYKVAYIYEENGPTIYLNGVTMENAAPITLLDSDMNIVVVADSTLEATGTGYAIDGTAGGNHTITSLNGAVLTLKAAASADFGGQEGGIITFAGNLTLKDANVNVEFDALTTLTSGIFVYGADLIVNGSVLNIGKGHAADTMNSPIQVVNGNLLIQNGSNVKVLSEANARPCRVDGTVTISDSDVEFAGEYGGKRVIWPEGKPTDVILNYTVPYTAKASATTPAVDPVAFTATIDEANLVDFADANVTTYYYVKITVNEEEPAPELPTVAGRTLTLGDVNDLNFFFAKSDLEGLDIADLTVYFTMERHEGLENRVVEANLEAYDGFGGLYYRVKFNNVAAKEMCDNIIVVVKDSEGNAVTKEYTTTMAKSIKDLHDTYTGEDAEKWQKLCVAMANYGAAAQIAFNYNVTDLASKYFTEG